MIDHVITQDRQCAEQFYIQALRPITLDAAALDTLRTTSEQYQQMLQRAHNK